MDRFFKINIYHFCIIIVDQAKCILQTFDWNIACGLLDAKFIHPVYEHIFLYASLISEVSGYKFGREILCAINQKALSHTSLSKS